MRCHVRSRETTLSRARRSTPHERYDRAPAEQGWLVQEASGSVPQRARTSGARRGGSFPSCKISVPANRAGEPDGTQGIRALTRPPQLDDLGHARDTSGSGSRARPGRAPVITRIRSRIRWQPISSAYSVLREIGDFWMIRQMLLNLRDRAEGRSAVSDGRIAWRLPQLPRADPDIVRRRTVRRGPGTSGADAAVVRRHGRECLSRVQRTASDTAGAPLQHRARSCHDDHGVGERYMARRTWSVRQPLWGSKPWRARIRVWTLPSSSGCGLLGRSRSAAPTVPTSPFAGTPTANFGERP